MRASSLSSFAVASSNNVSGRGGMVVNSSITGDCHGHITTFQKEDLATLNRSTHAASVLYSISSLFRNSM